MGQPRDGHFVGSKGCRQNSPTAIMGVDKPAMFGYNHIRTQPKDPLMTPQLIISLSPNGTLQTELPGANGSRRVVPIHDLSTIYRILSAQLTQPTSIGLDSAPTSGQVRHWERHSIFKVDTCPWCIAESLGIDVSRKHPRSIKMHIGDGSVTVTRYKAKSTSRSPKPIRLEALEDLL